MMSSDLPLASSKSQVEKSSKREVKGDVGLRAPFAIAFSCEPSCDKSVQITSVSPSFVRLSTKPRAWYVNEPMD